VRAGIIKRKFDTEEQIHAAIGDWFRGLDGSAAMTIGRRRCRRPPRRLRARAPPRHRHRVLEQPVVDLAPQVPQLLTHLMQLVPRRVAPLDAIAELVSQPGHLLGQRGERAFTSRQEPERAAWKCEERAPHGSCV
jgi:hypothetical protein